MAAHTDQSENTARERSVHIVLVPKHLRERVEEHVRRLVEDETDVSGHMLSGLMNGARFDDEMKKCDDKVISWSRGNTFLKCIG